MKKTLFSVLVALSLVSFSGCFGGDCDNADGKCNSSEKKVEKCGEGKCGGAEKSDAKCGGDK